MAAAKSYSSLGTIRGCAAIDLRQDLWTVGQDPYPQAYQAMHMAYLPWGRPDIPCRTLLPLVLTYGTDPGMGMLNPDRPTAKVPFADS